MRLISWYELMESSSRLHTSRRRDARPPSQRIGDPAPEDQRDDAHVVQIFIGNDPGFRAEVIPTRMHEPGFYVRVSEPNDPEEVRRMWNRSDDDPVRQQSEIYRSTVDLFLFKIAVDHAHVYVE